MRRLRWLALMGVLVGMLCGRGSASATAITLAADRDLSSLPLGAVFTVTVGLDDIGEIQAYTLDVAWSGAALSLIGSASLSCSETLPGTCMAAPFTLDPLVATTGPASTRAAVLMFPPFTLFIDGRTTWPLPDPRAGLFALTFEALEEGTGAITAGLLDPRADAVLGVAGSVSIQPLSTTLPFGVVPEPGTASLVLAAALGLATLRRARR
jgi:hypothetical protein